MATLSAPLVDAFVPQMLNYESVDGVSFKRDCYPSQEVGAASSAVPSNAVPTSPMPCAAERGRRGVQPPGRRAGLRYCGADSGCARWRRRVGRHRFAQIVAAASGRPACRSPMAPS